RQRCQTQAVQEDSISLLRVMAEREVRRYARKGIFTLTQLSYTFRLRKKNRRAKQRGSPHYPALKALAIRDKKTYILGTPEVPRANASKKAWISWNFSMFFSDTLMSYQCFVSLIVSICYRLVK